MSDAIDLQAENIYRKIKHYLITSMGSVIEEASDEEFYRAFALAFREEIMVNWTATTRSFVHRNQRMLYYLSMEYLPGRFMGNNITNLHAQELVRAVVGKANRKLKGVYDCELDPGLGNGGLGRLASCFLDSLATQHYPARGYGLRYQYGTFEQEIWNGVQIEKPDCWLLNENPWEFRRDQEAMIVKFCGRMIAAKNSHGEAVYDLKDYEEVRAIPYDTPIVGYSEKRDFSVNTLRLWSTKESPRNFEMQRFNLGEPGPASENTTLTDVLYPNDNHDVGKRIRLKQEFLLVSASLLDIIRNHLFSYHDLNLFADKVRIQVNDTHPALAIAELMRLLTKEQNYSWKKAWEITQECMSYTNHTILKEALECWNQNRMRHLLPRQYDIIEQLNLELCTLVRANYPKDEDKVRRMSIIEGGQVRMANLAIYGSHCVNGVAKLHSEIIKQTIFKDFYELYPEKFTNVTNGVTQRRWLLYCNPNLAKFITDRIGNKWITDFTAIESIGNFASDEQSQQEFLRIKQENKQRLAAYLKRTNKFRDIEGHPLADSSPDIDEDALFDVHVKRIHEYKRQLLNALHAIILYHELKENPNSRKIKRMILIGGKAAAGYQVAKNIIRLIHCISRKVNDDPDIQGKLKIVFIENYNVSKAELIIPAADLSEQISTAGVEASGTGNMKLSMNGALTIGTEDGANIEMRKKVTNPWWPFSFGCLEKEIDDMKKKGSYDPWTIYSESPKIAKALESLRDRTFSCDDSEHQTFVSLYYSLLERSYEGFPDRYFVLKDLTDYYETQKRVENLYSDKSSWAEHAIHNIAGMGTFSSDASVSRYAEKIWKIESIPPWKEILDKVRQDYAEHDKCRILTK